MRSFTVGALTFKNKSEAKSFMRELVAQAEENIPLADREHTFVCALTQRHPSAEQKIGVGIQYFTVRQDPYWKRSRQLILHRIDGTSTDLSWVACFDGKNERGDILGALRDAVAEQVIAVKRETFMKGGPVQCPYTGEILSSDHCHIDHEPPQDFASLVNAWLMTERLTLEDVSITDLQDHQLGREMANRQQKVSWQAFHRQHAKLRVVSVQANLTLRRYVSEQVNQIEPSRRLQLATEGFRWSAQVGRWMRGDQWQISDETIDRMTDEAWAQWLENL